MAFRARVVLACAEAPDAYMREGVCLAKLGQMKEAKVALDGCVAKSTGSMKEECTQLKAKLGP